MTQTIPAFRTTFFLVNLGILISGSAYAQAPLPDLKESVKGQYTLADEKYLKTSEKCPQQIQVTEIENDRNAHDPSNPSNTVPVLDVRDINTNQTVHRFFTQIKNGSTYQSQLSSFALFNREISRTGFSEWQIGNNRFEMSHYSTEDGLGMSYVWTMKLSPEVLIKCSYKKQD